MRSCSRVHVNSNHTKAAHRKSETTRLRSNRHPVKVNCIEMCKLSSVNTICAGRYKYVSDIQKIQPEAIDVHHIIVQGSAPRVLLFCFSLLLLSAILGLFFLFHQGKSIATPAWTILSTALVIRSISRKLVKRESVTIFPSFGVQLETQYRSGRSVRRFVPASKILKPVLNECVTPITCYWSLSLIIRDEEELLLVFKELYPPVKMLVPIWKALCSAVDSEETT